MSDEIKVGDRVQVYLRSEFWTTEGWLNGVVVRVDPYSEHRSFIWVELDEEADAQRGSGRLVSVLNPKNIRKV